MLCSGHKCIWACCSPILSSDKASGHDHLISRADRLNPGPRGSRRKMLVSRVSLQTANVEPSFLDGFISWSHPHSARDSETGFWEVMTRIPGGWSAIRPLDQWIDQNLPNI